jgi:carboxymethylenebutenolidase
MSKSLTIAMADGQCAAKLFTPAGTGPWPGVVFYMDAVALRPALDDMAQRLADLGYAVLLPDLFYRDAPFKPFDPSTLFGDKVELPRMMAMVGAMSNSRVQADVPRYIACLAAQAEVSGKLGAVGYCMGGKFALFSTAADPRVAAAASFHGAGLATDKPDSAHLTAGQQKARVYIGAAGIDAHFGAPEAAKLAESLRDGGIDYTIENYAGVHHGFAVDDVPAFDAAASARHWRRLAVLFEETLGA